jgi:hypothetical protein
MLLLSRRLARFNGEDALWRAGQRSYAYGQNDPARKVDPPGMDAEVAGDWFKEWGCKERLEGRK